jgi:tRNA A-37 threonylcarbamoyl transferase component Bud32
MNFEAAFAPGAQLGDYRIVRLLGQGAAGAVYEVIKTSVAKRMALKVLHRALGHSGDDLRRFEREAMIAGAIEHPNVMQVFDVGEHDGHYFMAMEYLEGETLLARLEREGALPVRAVADLFVPIASALGAVHDQGVVHRDLKPGNIFLVAKRPGVVEPKLLDFGVIKDLSGIVGGDMTRAHSMVGSPSYMSPEQAEQSRALDARSDQFTLGSILWECLVGRKLFDGDTLYQVLFKIADDPITPPRALRADVPPDLDAVVLRALARDPAQRFASVRELGVALLPHCSDHVRAVWQHELLASVGIAPAEDHPRELDDAPTTMVSRASLGPPMAFPGGETLRPASLPAASPPRPRRALRAVAAVLALGALGLTAAALTLREPAPVTAAVSAPPTAPARPRPAPPAAALDASVARPAPAVARPAPAVARAVTPTPAAPVTPPRHRAHRRTAGVKGARAPR